MNFGKKTIIYSSISLIFIIYLFSADYIFNVLIKTDQEAKIVDINLPPETHNIQFAIDEANQVKLKWKDAFFITGWVFKENVKEKKRDVYLVLKGNKNTLIFDIENDSKNRSDVAQAFGLGDIHGHGFELTLVTYVLKEDSYQIGSVINDSTGKYYHNSNKVLVKTNDTWAVTQENVSAQKKFVSEKKSLSVKKSTGSVNHSIDTFEYADEAVTVSGWGFLDGLNTDAIKHYILFKKGDDLEIFDTDARTRTDVTNHFKDSGLNLDSSGFLAIVPIEKLPKGSYQVGMYLVKAKKQGAVFFDRYIEIQDDSSVRIITKDEYEKM